MNLQNLKRIFTDRGCKKIYIKKLSPNDNSKNQIYLAGSFDLLNIFPVSDIVAEEAGEWKKERFKAAINFSWISDDGNLYLAPNSKFILYPEYPEVRFSGFLINCKQAPSDLLNNRMEGRLLFLGVGGDGSLMGYVCAHDTMLAREFDSLHIEDFQGVFSVILLEAEGKVKLLDELRRIHLLDWIESKRLDKTGEVVSCTSPNCGGYTLEAELGITPNGYSEPDFLGWEVKQFGVKSFDSIKNAVITLMTPEPTGGYYRTEGVEKFLFKYGYPDKMGRPDRINFGGIHKAGVKQPSTNLTLSLLGFDFESGKIRNAGGRIALLANDGTEAATWDFASLLKHWNRKHNQACYVPSIVSKSDIRKYKFGSKVILGEGTSFQLFLAHMANGNIYFDPGIKMESVSSSRKIKRRSQFRISSTNLGNLYTKQDLISLTTPN